jgi:hypothetical protein
LGFGSGGFGDTAGDGCFLEEAGFFGDFLSITPFGALAW